MNQRPDLYKNNIKNENTTNQQNNNTTKKPNTVEPNNNAVNKPNTIEQDNKNTSIVEYKKENRIISWIKNRINYIKEKFNAIKEKNQKGKEAEQEDTTSKKNKFIENITQKGKLQSKEQQAKAFETVKKWEQKIKKK